MEKTVVHYYRDDIELPFDEWISLFKLDLDIENKNSTFDITSAVWSDYGNGRDINLNNHDYKSRIDYVYTAAKDLLEDILDEGYYDDILYAIKALPEEEAKKFAHYINRVQIDGQNYILKDIRDN